MIQLRRILYVAPLTLLFIFYILASAYALEVTIYYATPVLPAKDGYYIIGPAKDISGATPLFKLPLNNGSYAVVYRVDNATDLEILGDLNIDAVPLLNYTLAKQYTKASVNITFDIAPGNNYVYKSVHNASLFYSSSEEIEGLDWYNGYLYASIAYSGTEGKLYKIDADGNYLDTITMPAPDTVSTAHAGGFLQYGLLGYWIIPVSGDTSDSDTYIDKVYVNGTAVKVGELQGVHLGNVVAVDGDKIYLGDWDTQNVYIFNISTWQEITSFSSSYALYYVQDVKQVKNNLYVGVYQNKDNKIGNLNVYAFNESNTKLVWSLMGTTPLNLTNRHPFNNGLAIDWENGYIYYSATTDTDFKITKASSWRDVFIPIIYLKYSNGDRWNLALSESFPLPNSYEQFISISYKDTGAQIRICYNKADSYVGSDFLSSTDTYVLYYYGRTAYLWNGADYVTLDGYGLPGGDLQLGAQTWSSANQNFTGEAYLIKAIPYVITTSVVSSGSNGSGGSSGSTQIAIDTTIIYVFLPVIIMLMAVSMVINMLQRAFRW